MSLDDLLREILSSIHNKGRRRRLARAIQQEARIRPRCRSRQMSEAYEKARARGFIPNRAMRRGNREGRVPRVA